ncbi:MAG: Lambda phage tail tape-measure protein [Rhodobacteraceae bacterium HLUCCA12]|nr:MAG: Lambda phage tail tape-measure protein [Rhodobacteraceae bacterium HLUCCA12]
MAEKRVSVRLAAVGGRQVRAELEGVGEAGSRGFGRLSREMEAANARLAAFSRRARIALSAAAAGVTTALAAMTRATIQVATQTQQFAQVANTAPEAFQRWAGASRTVGIEQEKLADILKDVNDRVGDVLSTGGGPMADFFERVAPRVGVTADQFARLSGPEALQLYVDTLERAGLSQQEMTFYLETMASDATRLLPLLRNGGAEMERLGAQADDLGAVLDASAIQTLQRTQIALVGVFQVFEGIRNRIGVALAPAVEWLANAFVSLASEGGVLRGALDALIGNIGRLSTYAATFAGVMAARWVAGFVAAAISVRGLATALVVLRGALIRTGIGALIVGAGEVAYQFTRLISGAGGFGSALELMGNVARAVWGGIRTTMGSFVDEFRALRADIEGIWTRLMSFLAGKWVDFLAMIGPAFNAVAERIGADFQIDWFGAQAQASMLDHAASNADIMAGLLRQRAADTRGGAFDGVREAVTALIAAARGSGEETEDALDSAAAGARRVTEALDAAETSAGRAGASGRQAGADIATGAEEALTGWRAVTAALSDYASRAREIGGDIGQSLVGAFQSAENAVGQFVKTGKLNFRDLVTSLLADLAQLAARRFILGPIANALSGVFSGAGGIFANILHAGGMVGSAGPSRMVPAMAFAAAPRMHGGGMAGLRHDEVPAILQRGERVLSRREAQSYGAGGGVNVTIMARDAESFRQSRTQVAADIARAVSLGRRGM